jgi:hypothetical protein
MGDAAPGTGNRHDRQRGGARNRAGRGR